MPHNATYQARRFGPAASTIALSTKGGAVLGNIWISAKGSAPSVAAYDGVASVAANAILPATIPAAVGNIGPIACEVGTALTITCLSCTGVIYWRPGQAGGA